jgi:hypothetical protein
VLAGDLVVVHQRRRRSVRPAGWEARGYRRIGAVHLRLDGAYRFASGYLERSIQIGRSGGVIWSIKSDPSIVDPAVVAAYRFDEISI